jgi:gamma-glutamylcysteine synthetase
MTGEAVMLKHYFSFNTRALQSAAPQRTGSRVQDVLKDRFSAILNRLPVTSSRVGVELEFPLCTTAGRAVERKDDVVAHLARVLSLHVTKWSDDGEAIAARTADGTLTIGYEYARALLEFTFAPARDCVALGRLLEVLHPAVNDALAGLGMYLGDTGLHPQHWSRTAPPLSTPHYRAVNRFLKRSGRGGSDHRFTGFIASSQTHIDTCASSAPILIELYHRTAFVSALLFANSPATYGGIRHQVARDYLWNTSAFGSLGGYTRQPEAQTIEHVLRNETKRGLFLARRGDTLWNFEPVTLAQLDQCPVVTAYSDRRGEQISSRLKLTPDDAQLCRAYGYAVPTTYGTIEIRSDCLQPKDALLMPAAFAIGLSETAKSVIAYMNSAAAFSEPMQLRAKAARDGWSMSTRGLQRPLPEICQKVLEFAAQGLELRGFGERHLLDPLFDRVTQRTNPALQQRQEA